MYKDGWLRFFTNFSENKKSEARDAKKIFIYLVQIHNYDGEMLREAIHEKKVTFLLDTFRTPLGPPPLSRVYGR